MPESIPTAELLATAAVTLNRHKKLLSELGALFDSAGFDLYLVGGSVRDAALGKPGIDLDFTTDARPEQVQNLVTGWAEAIWDTGIAFGTIGVARRGQRVEITTFRSDSYDQQSRNPEVVFGDSLEGDLVRRDFTVNAMAVKIGPDGPGEFCDPLNGLEALRAGVLDTPSAPEISFGDDPLRMLRAARFVSQLGFTVAPRVLEALHAMADQLGRITAERVQTELDKLIVGAHPVAGIDLLVDSGLGAVVLPEVGQMQLTIDEHHQHKDVYRHSLTVLEQAVDLEDEGPDLVLRWAALLHDIGKPATRRHEEGGGVSFHHHEVVGAKMVRKRMRALKYSSRWWTTSRSWCICICGFTGTGTENGPIRRYADTSPTRGRCCRGCTSWCARTAPRVTNGARRGCRPTMTGSKRASRSWRPRRIWRACGPISTATRSWSCWAFRPAQSWGRPGSS